MDLKGLAVRRADCRPDSVPGRLDVLRAVPAAGPRRRRVRAAGMLGRHLGQLPVRKRPGRGIRRGHPQHEERPATLAVAPALAGTRHEIRRGRRKPTSRLFCPQCPKVVLESNGRRPSRGERCGTTGELVGQEVRRKEAEDRARIKGMICLDATRRLPSIRVCRAGPTAIAGVVERGDTPP
jgi:hypothetical protein